MRCRALALPAMALALAPGAWAQTASSTVWTRWEASLTSSKTYANPYADVTVSVTYTGPSGQTFGSHAFWDGGSTWRLRCAFPATGTWTWKTSCSDTSNGGLHNRSGSVSVSSYGGTNPLYQRGFLKGSGSKRHLTFNDGTPFLWMGDTAWVAPLKASQADWQAYVDDRAAKGFTVIQISPASSWGGNQDTGGNAPFLGSGISKWNPPYWQGFDRKVQYANDKGIVILLVGIMEPTFRYPSSADAQRFARNIAARLHGNFAVLSPSFDSPYMTLGDDVGNTLNASTSRHLVTQHVGTSLSAAQSYYDKGYLDFCGEQSGHNGGDRERCAERAITWTLALYGRSPFKPVINLEAFYDANGTTAGLEPKYLGTAKDARQLGYLSWLSGSLGYTYGAYGLWNWQTDSSKGYYWSKAVQYPSSTQMKHLANLFRPLAWWRLEPQHGLITNQPSTYLQRMVLAKTASGDLAVGYLPDNSSMTLSMGSFPTPMSARWYSPTTGASSAGPASVPNTGSYSFSRPGSGDWALVLTPASGGGAATFPAKINFQLAGAPVPTGYLADAGALYGSRGNGHTYGWSSDHTDVTRDRNLNADPRLDTLCHFHSGAKWEIAVPSGSYDVKVSVGDAGFASTHTIRAEGVSYWSGLDLAANQFASLTRTVSVSDGRLTIDQGAAPDKATRINYVEISPSSGGGGTFTVTIDSVSTGRPYSLSTAQAGALYYIDRSYTITSLGSTLNGGVLLRTANDDKNVTSPTHLRFTLSGPASLYVCYDKRATKNPTWLNDGTWTITGDVFQVTDGGASPMRVFTKAVAAGQVTLGGNQTGGPTGAASNYVVVIRSTGSAAASFKSVAPDAWEHPGDADGDGLMDGFEATVFTDPANPDTDGDGDPDESELGSDGRTLWEAQEASSGGGASGGGGGDGGCGLLGLEALLLLNVLRKPRR